jgi:hypothetical protein
MSLFYEDDIEALRRELSSVRARQEVLADALAAAGEEMEKLQALREERDTLRAAILTDLGEHDEMLQLGGSGDFYNCRNVVRGGTDASTSGPPTEETA